MLSHFGRVRLSVTMWALQAPVYAILQAKKEYWTELPCPPSRGPSQPRDRTWVSYASCIGRQFLYHLCHLGTWDPIRLEIWSKVHVHCLDWGEMWRCICIIAKQMTAIRGLHTTEKSFSLYHAHTQILPSLNSAPLSVDRGMSRATGGTERLVRPHRWPEV